MKFNVNNFPNADCGTCARRIECASEKKTKRGLGQEIRSVCETATALRHHRIHAPKRKLFIPLKKSAYQAREPKSIDAANHGYRNLREMDLFLEVPGSGAAVNRVGQNWDLNSFFIACGARHRPLRNFRFRTYQNISPQVKQLFDQVSC
jgi:hypothetical protein